MAAIENTLQLLHELIQTCKDGETGYAHAAGVVEEPALKKYFSEQSLERGRFVKELLSAAEALGYKPDASGTIEGALHRVWFEAKADLGLGDQAVLNSVEQGEDVAKKAYSKALEADLPHEVRQMIHNQSISVYAAHDYVRDLRDKRVPRESAADRDKAA